MKLAHYLAQASIAAAIAAAATFATTASVPAAAQTVQSAGNDVLLSVGRGRLVSLPSAMSDIFIADDKIADVQVRSSRQLYIFGKTPGETSVYATDSSGKVVYSATIRVGNNIETIDQMLALAMPEAHIIVTPMNGFVLLTGTVAAPQDAAEADRLVQAFVGEGQQVLSRLQTATPLQVNLQVRIAEVNRSLVKDIGANLATTDTTGGFVFGVSRGSGGIVNPATGAVANQTSSTTVGGIVKNLLGLNLNASFDLAERAGLVTTLAQPNLTALSGETADFLAGGEFPIPVSQAGASGNSITVEFRKYGVSLAYTPTVLSNGRISMRVRPEVSELSSEGAVTIGGFQVPALTIRRTETTVEMGSGESMMIAGLLNNRSTSSIEKTPGVGDIPILGALFKSDNYRRGETELVIVVTPYLVKPVTASRISLPTDGYETTSDLDRVFMGKTSGASDGTRPMPRSDTAPTPDPRIIGAVPPAADKDRRVATKSKDAAASAPGFSF
ncbi:type II and III secretion system protein family protein [Sphingorhabdus soli]|uniref:Type II and III secretion system protein family protein n=1 Tax=Flavisphingopyxis soli TaxID=2601267 RepID=A0A5C6UAC9_9SPHN|nr:type II and III secretion system protein family protein [Sphingorhabdus soli]TXC68705.1 type II and III secretion system protein family protein [Sphingorhabdus soli]